MKIVRLENTSFGFSSLWEDEVDKVLGFDSESGTLKVHSLQSPRRVPFGLDKTELIQKLFGQDFSDGTVRIIHNLPVPDAYSAPFKIYLDITLTCSLQCHFCLSEAGSGLKTSLSVITIEKLA